ncbi:MAG TPA: hypothetical protein VE621_00540 [Bryobacteraceae bacterium]|nr:hypothetical protein [Bryobacteraceae bacterium]
MSQLTEKELRAVARAAHGPQEAEIGCDDCLMQVGAYCESQLAGRAIPEALRPVHEHLSMCPECREEYEALVMSMKQTDS